MFCFLDGVIYMSVKQKIRDLSVKQAETTCKYVWILPMFEVFIVLPLFLSFCSNQFLILHFNTLFICSLGKLFIETAIIKKSLILFVVAFVCFASKIVSSFFMLKKSKWGYISIISLYLIDFIVSLVILFNSETTLQELGAKDLIDVFLLLLAPTISCVYVYLYFYIIKHREKTKELKIFTSIIFSIVIIAVGVMGVNGNKQIATDNEIATLNRCYEYSEKYLYKALPDDKEMLGKMLCDIEEVFEKELFFTAFRQSDYFTELKEEQKSNDYVTPIITKSIYANDLMYLKSKILLKLDKDDEYIDYYIETRRWFSTPEVEFYYKYLEQDIINYSDDDCEVVKKACVEFMDEDVNRIEKLWATIDYSRAAGKDLTKEERQEISKEFREEHLPDYYNDKIRADLLELEEYKATERTLYMLK